MRNLLNGQAGAAKAPAIPSMDVSPPPPATTGREIARAVRDQVRDQVRQARIAAQAAKNGAPAAVPVIAGQDAGHTATTAPPYDANNLIPPQVEDISIAFFVTVAFCIVGFPLARAFARRMDRKTIAPSPDLMPQIRQLQDSVDAMAIELERISEGQRFTAKLLADRSAAPLHDK